MEHMPYLIPTTKLSNKSISTAAAFNRLIESFIPASGLDQTSGSPSREFIQALTNKDFKFKDERSTLLYKLSVHPRESVRDWAENQLCRYTNDEQTHRVLNDRDSSIIFPWRASKPYFEFSTTRALLLTRHEKITAEMAMFLVQFRHEAISAKLINYILKDIPNNNEPGLPTQIEQLLREIATSHRPSARITIAKNKKLNWRVFDDLIQKGLPLYSMDAIAHTDWDLYSKNASQESRKEVISHLIRFAKHNSSVAKTIKDWGLKY